MTEQVMMDHAGVRSLIRLAREQHDHLDAILTFTRDTGLHESSWFDRGFLASFRGDYDAATADVGDSMGRASSGTCQLAGRIVYSRDLLDEADRQVKTGMVRLQAATEGTQVPEFLRRCAGVTGLGGIATPGRHRAPVPEGSVSHTIDAISSIGSMAHHTGQVGDAIATDDELDDFVEEHRD